MTIRVCVCVCVIPCASQVQSAPVGKGNQRWKSLVWIESVRGYNTSDLDEAPTLHNNALYCKRSIIAVKCIKRSRVLHISLWLMNCPFVAIKMSFSVPSVICFESKDVEMLAL